MSEREAPEFHIVRRGSEPVPLALLGRRRVLTLEGRIARGPLARPWAVAGLFTALILAGELSTLFLSARTGIMIHSATLLLVITHAALLRRSAASLSDLLVALTPVPLIRIVSLTSPLAQFSYVQWFTLIAVILYAGIVTAIKILKPDLASIGLRLPAARHLPLEALVVVAGIGFGWLEYHILYPGALVNELSLRQLVAPILVLYISTGLLEELLFRGILQKYGGRVLGVWGGIAFSTLLFGIMHIGWNSVLDVLFVTAVGLIYALVVHRTRSIIGVSLSHGVTNAMLFLVMPFLAGR